MCAEMCARARPFQRRVSMDRCLYQPWRDMTRESSDTVDNKFARANLQRILSLSLDARDSSSGSIRAYRVSRRNYLLFERGVTSPKPIVSDVRERRRASCFSRHYMKSILLTRLNFVTRKNFKENIPILFTREKINFI